MKMKKVFALGLSLALALTMFSGCGKKDESSSASSGGGSAASPVTVTYANAGDIANLDPRRGTSTTTACILADMYSTLLKTNAKGEIVCDAAKSYDRVDEVTWHFTLRDDIYFTNGDQLTSADVAYTFDTLRKNEGNYALAGDFSFIQAEVINDFELNLITDKPFNSLPLRLNYVKIIPSRYVQVVGDEAFAAAPIGSGPFKFVSWEKDVKVVLEKNPDYYGEVPQFDRLVYRIIPEAADRVAALQSGEVDIIASIPTTQAEYLNGQEGITVFGQPSARLFWVQFNLVGAETPLNDIRVRQAVNYALDRDVIIDGVLDGNAVKVASISTPEYANYDPNVKGYEHDLEKAKALMTEAGYADGFTVDLSFTPGALNASDVVQAIAAQLAEINITVNPVQTDSQTQRAEIKAGTIAPMSIQGIGGPYSDIDLIATISFTEGARYCTWVNHEFMDLADRARSTTDEKECADLYSQMQQFMVDEAPCAWLYQQNTLYAYNSNRIHGWTPRVDEVVLMDGVTVS